MCGLAPMLGVLSGVAQFAGQSAAAKAENTARAQNRTAAVVDYNNQITNESHNLTQANKTTNAEGFDATVAARAAISKANAEAASLGAGGVSVDAVLNELEGQAGRNERRIQDKHEANALDFTNNVTTHHATAANRVRANQPVPGPSPLGLMINIAGAFA